jgi:cytochrome c-type biogenesis protein CcmH/NrfF
MATDINYWWTVPVLLLLILLVIWLIRRNRKDEKELEKEIIESELKPEKHTEDKEVGP